MLRAQQLARQDVKTDKGYAMMMTSIITIMLFSLMGAFLTMTNLAKSSTDAYIDGNSTFYAAESGLNKRAQELRARFENYNSPSDGAITAAEKADTSRKPTAMSPCYSKPVISSTNLETTNDFECRNFPYKYNNNIAKTAGSSANTIVLSEADNNTSTVNYTAFTFVSDKTNYDNSSTPAPIPIVIPNGTYKDLNAQEYKYTVNATAAKPNGNITGSQVGESGDNKTVLQMDFKSRAIPLFQFGAFYTRDLELNPSPAMTFNGRIHSNQKVYLTAGDRDINTLTLNSIISAVTSINTGNPALSTGYQASGTVKIQTDPADATSLVNLPETAAPTTAAPVPVASFATTYNSKLKIAPTALTPPPVGFLTKADATRSDGIGEYYAKADLRLEMFPDRAVPFKLQVIKSGGTSPSTTCAAAPFNTTVSKERAEYNKLECTDLNESQLRSLMQPVLVRPRKTEEYTKFCTNTVVGTPPQLVGTPPQVAGTAVNINNTDLDVKDRILDALALTLASETTPVKYSDLGNPLSTTQQTRFGLLLAKIFGTTPSATDTADIATLQGATPIAIAALKGSCFRPAPIQALFTPGDFSTSGAPDNTKLALNTPTSFNDRREKRYIRMLQTNIESLTLWNRDGLFVQGSASTFAANVTALPDNFTITSKLWEQQGASSGDNRLFARAAAVTTAPVYVAATGTYTDQTLDPSYRTMGLAATDRTEGGLVLHATIDKATYPYLATPTTPDTNSLRQSPYGFAFNDGANLPAPLTIATDQPLYSQGDWNNVDKQPASFLADTIAILSNSCLATADTGTISPTWASTSVSTTVARLRGTVLDTFTGTTILPPTLSGQINCGSISGIPTMATPTTVNGAFLSKTDTSTTSPLYYSGGLNNYMRILETWTNRAMNYSGSFISLGAPSEVSGRYKEYSGFTLTNNYGCPPNRNWSYDTSFNSYQGLPPLPPKVIEIQQDSFRRKYN
jgi:hypothetical protein